MPAFLISSSPGPKRRGGPSEISLKNFLLLLLTLLFSISPLQAEETNNIPYLYQVGIIPAQIDLSLGNASGLEEAIEFVKTGFSQAVRNSRRFRVLDDELVKGLWALPRGRQELIDDQKLSAFVHLTITPKQDSVVFIARLLGNDFSPYLQEMETVGRVDLSMNSYDQTYQVLSHLVFRLFNRLPVDVYISSIEGRYITLTGGVNQGVYLGDELTVIRPTIVRKHPANQSWQEFSVQLQGHAKVIETKENTSVAQLTSLTYENAVEVGDGVKISTLASRNNFARRDIKKTFEEETGKLIILTPKFASSIGALSSDVAVKTPEPIPEESKIPNPEMKVVESPKKEEMKDSNAEDRDTDEPNAKEEALSPVYSSSSKGDILFETGQTGLAITGPVGVGSAFSFFLPLNNIGATYTQTLMEHVKSNLGGMFLFGRSQKKNRIMVLEGEGELYWEDVLKGMRFADTWQFGANGLVEKYFLTKESLTGMSKIVVGGFFKVLGKHIQSGDPHPWQWWGKLQISPIGFGQTVYVGATSSILSYFGYSIEVGALHLTSSKIQWGGKFLYSNNSFSDNSSYSFSGSQYSLAVLAKYTLP